MLSRRRHGIRVLAYFLAELAVVAASFPVGYWVRMKTSPLWGMPVETIAPYLWLWPLTVLVWSVFLWVPTSYDGFRNRSVLYHGYAAAVSSGLSVISLFALVTLFKRYGVNRSLIGMVGISAFASLFLTRIAARAFLVHYTQKGYDRHYVIVGGADERAVALAETLENEQGRVFQVRGFVTETPGDPGRPLGRWSVLGTFSDLPAIASKTPVDEVFLLPTSGPLEAQLPLIQRCEEMGMSVHLRLSPFEKSISRLELEEVGGWDYLRFTTTPRSGSALFAKRVLDVFVAAFLLALLSPLLLLVALLVRLTSRGPTIFRQERAGRNGRVFTLYKFRTMVEGAEKDRANLESKNEMEGPVFKIKDDPRVTGLGKFLRRTSIDELPQLWNILKGDMSLVGPRPLPLYEVEKFEPWQRRRMSMRPGITCLWQVSGRSKVVSFTDWMRLDLEYVDHWSLRLDVKILLRTIPAVLGAKGAY